MSSAFASWPNRCAPASSAASDRKALPADDPRHRQPDIALAQRELGWQPRVSLEQGLEPTIARFQALLG